MTLISVREVESPPKVPPHLPNVAVDDLKLCILLLPPKCWDERHMPVDMVLQSNTASFMLSQHSLNIPTSHRVFWNDLECP